MGSAIKSRGFLAAAATVVSLALLLPANAQFWGDSWGNRQPRQNNGWGWGGGWGDQAPRPRNPLPFQHREQRHQEREREVDYSRAPAASPRKDATTQIVVMGDAMADWLAYGLEDALSEKPEFGVVRKHRTDSGIIRYEHRRDKDIEWVQIAREIIAAEKPKFIVMMVGNNDRQAIREKPPVAARPVAPKPAAQPASPPAQAAAPEPAKPANAEQQDAELQPPEQNAAPEPAPVPTTEQGRLAAYGPWEFRSEKWEVAYIKRVDATIAALKSAGVPVIWVGLPAQRAAKATQDVQYLNEIYKSRADRAGIVYVDIWDGFVDESGRFSPTGPDYEGQIRRLRSADGVYFTKFGARKLALYVDREIQRNIVNRAVPVALPPVEPGAHAPNGKSGGPQQRPAVGPVLPLTATPHVASEELLGGSRAPPRPGQDPVAARVLTKGEPIAAPTGRADDFSWPPKPVNVDPSALPATPPSPAVAVQPKPAQVAGEAAPADTKPPAQKKRRATRPPVALNPQGFFGGLFR
jgi:hypothetical protein